MRVIADNLWATVEEAGADELRWLEEYLTIDAADAEKTTAYQEGKWDGKVRLYDRGKQRFAAGLIRLVWGRARQAGYELAVNDARVRPDGGQLHPAGAWLRDYQRAALDAIHARGRGVVSMPTGSGKCLGEGTPVLMYDGEIKAVEDVKVGDRLMGPDSEPRRVLSLSRGTGELRQIQPAKGQPWVCNDVHVLTLVHTVTGAVVDVALDEYEGWSRTQKHLHKLFTVGVEFFAELRRHEQEPPLPVDPYFLGIWIGDGRKDLNQGVSISKPDVEIREACAAEAARWGLELRVDVDPKRNCPAYRIVKPTMGPSENPLTKVLRSLCPLRPEVPRCYLTGTREVRSQVLAGLLDTDSWHDGFGGFQFISQKDQTVANQVAFLARSLGLRATQSSKHVPGYGTYAVVNISGDTRTIPTRIPRKQAPVRLQRKNATRTGFSVTPIGIGQYYGFTLDGDGRFLLGDFTVTHNTELFAALVQSVRIRWLVLVDTKDLLYQAAERIEKRLGERAGLVGDSVWAPSRVTVATFQTLVDGIGDRRVDDFLASVQGLVADEVQVLAANEFRKVAMACPAAWWRVGLSATPLERQDERDYRTIEALGPIIHELSASELIARGVLAAPDIVMVEFRHERMSGSFAEVYEAGVSLNVRRNALLMRLAADPAFCPRPTIAFVKDLGHGRRFTKFVAGYGCRAEFICGQDSKVSRQYARINLEVGEIDVLVTSKIFNKGIDIPGAMSGVNGAAGKSTIDAIQKVGRLMRIPQGSDKRSVRYYDVMDRGNRWLEGHAHLRLEAYRARGYRVRIVSSDMIPPVEPANTVEA